MARIGAGDGDNPNAGNPPGTSAPTQTWIATPAQVAGADYNANAGNPPGTRAPTQTWAETPAQAAGVLQNNQAAATAAANAAARRQSAQNADQIIEQFFAGIPGLANLDPNNALSAWAIAQVSLLTGQGLDASAIATQIETTMNNPAGDKAALAIFNQLFPGYNERIQQFGTSTLGGYTGLAGYIQYSAQLQDYATRAGLTKGTLTQQDIGQLWTSDVSSDEVNTRITEGYTAAMTAPPETRQYLQQYYGISTGDIASYYLNPDTTLKTLQTQLNTASLGGAAEATGFGNLSQSQAASLQAFLATGAGMGGAASLTQQQATNALLSPLAPGTSGAAQMAKAGFEGALPGQAANGPGVLSQGSIIGALEGNVTDIAAARLATGTRTASTGGGGGAAVNEQGAAGVGFGSQQ